MASLGHIAVGMFAGRAWAPRDAPWRHVFAACVVGASLAMLPDLDVVAFALHIPYSAPWGHRGAAHSLVVAIVLGCAVGLFSRIFLRRRAALETGAIAIVVLLSHGLLDTLTDGGLGVALLWPFEMKRFFAPVRPIPVAPIGAGMFSHRGLYVSIVELVMFAPLWLAALLWKRRRPSNSTVA